MNNKPFLEIMEKMIDSKIDDIIRNDRIRNYLGIDYLSFQKNNTNDLEVMIVLFLIWLFGFCTAIAIFWLVSL